MHIEDIREFCLSLSFVTEEMPFGPDTLVFKVGGKIFLLVGLEQIDTIRFNVKCDPEYAVELRERYENTVLPGYHMNKKHWNTVYCNRELSVPDLKKLIVSSYDLVYLALTRSAKEKLHNQLM